MDEDAYQRDNYEDDTCRSEQPPDGPPQYWIKVNDYHGITNFTSDTLKLALINHGPLGVTIYNYNPTPHSMALVGYGKVKPDDIIHNPNNPSTSDTVDSNSNYIGHSYWILKNSSGPGWGDLGYFTVPFSIENDIDNDIFVVGTPILTQPPNLFSRIPYDNDYDGYWNWGISEEYELPVGACSNDKDSDDSENRLGPFDDNFYSVSIMSAMKVNLHPNHSIAPIWIDNNSFISFSDYDLFEDSELHFYIKNPGDAQLNLFPVGIIGEGKVEVVKVNGASEHYDIFLLPQRKVCMGDSNLFIVTFTGSVQGELTKIKIYLDENGEIPDFEFILVYNDCQLEQGVIEITGDQTWDSFALKTKDYHILPQATLTVTGEVAMGINSDIFVAPDGKLIIDGGRLTSACSGLWNGIDVWGDPRQPQIMHAQGMVEIKNGGTIEFADTAIATVRINGIYTISTGGIINCEDAILKDNYVGIYMSPYVEPHGHPNISRFIRTQFIITDDYYSPEILVRTAPKCGFQMGGVTGINLEGCGFTNESRAEKGKRGSGVIILDAGCNIINACEQGNQPPYDATIPNRFEGFDYGIKSSNIYSSRMLTVESADFIENYRGIYMSLINDATIIKNTFEMSTDNEYFQPGDILVGLYTERCNRYHIEENNFIGTDPHHIELVGMHILNSGSNYNEIYNNSMVNLDYGIITAGENRNKDGSNGLCVKCNDFKDCIMDIYITPEGGFNYDLLGIATNQGTKNTYPNYEPDLAAGNTFSVFIEGGNNFINDKSLNALQYVHHYIPSTDEKVKPDPYINIKPDEDQLASYSKPLSCPSNLNGGGIILSKEKSIILSESLAISSLEDTLTMRIDGGDTHELDFEIQTSFPEEALQLRQQLIDESPYLSDTVMKSAIERENILLNAMIRDILVANPQSAKTPSVLDKLNNRYDPLPDYMIEEIVQGQEFYGAKELLLQNLAVHNKNYALSLGNLIHFFKLDTSYYQACDSLIDLIRPIEKIDSKYESAFLYFDKQDTLSLLSFLNNIPFEFTLEDDQQVSHELYLDLFDVLLHLQADSCNIDSALVQKLLDLADNEAFIPSVYSRNVLVTNNLIPYQEPVYLADNPMKSIQIPPSSRNNSIEKKPYLNVFPNPANSYLIIEYDLRNFYMPGIIIISNQEGKLIKIFSINDKQNQKIIETDSFSAGVYFVSLYINYKLEMIIKTIVY